MPRRADVPRLVVAWLAASAFAAPAAASLVRALALHELTAESDRIVVGDVLSVRTAWDGSHRSIYTIAEVAVRESWKGAVAGDGRVTVRQLGGTVGEIEMTVVGAPRFETGERSLLFLRQDQVVGMAQGKRPVRWEAATRQWLVGASDGTGVVAVDPAGRMRPGRPEPAEPLDRLRARVADLLRN